MTVSPEPRVSPRLVDEVRYFVEAQEAELTRYGLYDPMTTVAEVERRFFPSRDLANAWHSLDLDKRHQEVRAAVSELVSTGVFIRFDDGPVESWHLRSRMAEIVRLTLKVRQRFRHHRFFTNSPSLVQDIHYEVRPRRYPRRDQAFSHLEGALFGAMSDTTAGRVEARAAWEILAAGLAPDGGEPTYSSFQMRAYRLLGEWLMAGQADDTRGLVVGAGTGAGKTNTFFVPALAHAVLEKMVRGQVGTKAIAVYPRIKLAQNQFETFLGFLRHVNDARGDHPAVTIAIDYGDIQYLRSNFLDTEHKVAHLKKWNWGIQRVGEKRVAIFPAAKCPACEGPLGVALGAYEVMPPLKCVTCRRVEPAIKYVREEWKVEPPDFYVATTESLNARMVDGGYVGLFGEGTLADGRKPGVPAVVMLDEIHLHVANKGMQVGYLVRRLRERLRRAADRRGQPPRLVLVGLSATIAGPRNFFHRLTGVAERRVEVVMPQDDELERMGAEYSLFVKANAEERTGAMSTLLQSTMVLLHNMQQPPESAWLTLGFADSHDLVGRWQHQLADAERQGLWGLRDVEDNRRLAERYFRVKPKNCADCTERPDRSCVVFREGECWWPMSRGGDALDRALTTTVETSLRSASLNDFRTKDLVVATSRLEVGYDDDRIMAVVQYQAPSDAASFIQRKGRAGRQYGTFPITMLVLNAYRAQDAFYFKNPHLLTAPVFRELPLNPDNRLIQRIHGFYAMFEYLIARQLDTSGGGRASLSFTNLGEATTDIRAFANLLRAWTSTEKDLEDLREAVARSLDISRDQATVVLTDEEGVLRTGLTRLVERAEGQTDRYVNGFDLMRDYLPRNFFSDINLPMLRLQAGDGLGSGTVEELDLAPGLRQVMPGKVSWRGETPFWVPPVLTDGGRHRWYDVGEDWTCQELPTPLNGQRVPERIRKRLDLPTHEGLPIMRPREVRVQALKPRQGNPWLLGPEVAGSPYRDVSRVRPGDRLDERSAAYGLAFDRVEFDERDLPPALVLEGRTEATAEALGPYAGKLVGRLRLADCRFRPMRVWRCVAGGEANLRWSGGNGYAETYGFRHGGRPCLIGYELATEGVSFDLAPNLWTRPLTESDMAALRPRTFALAVRSDLQAQGENSFTSERLITGFMIAAGRHVSAGGTLERFDETLESEAGRRSLEVALEQVMRLRGETLEETIALFEAPGVREVLRRAWRGAWTATGQVRPGGLRDFAWDARVASLAQAILLAAQDLAGVEVGQQLGVRGPLRLDDGRTTAPAIHLFEEGLGGLGIARALHERLRLHPLAFWDAVEAHLRHCPVGDDEDLVRGLLARLPQDSMALAERATAVWQADSTVGRLAALQRLQRHLRTDVGLDPTPEATKAILRLFSPPLEEWGLAFSNWELTREINIVVAAALHVERGYRAGDYEVTERVLAVLKDRPAELPAHAALANTLRSSEPEDWENHEKAVAEALTWPAVSGLFGAIASLDELAALIDMNEQDRQLALKAQYGLTAPDSFRSPNPAMSAEDAFLAEFDATYFGVEERPLWAESVWMFAHGQGGEMHERFALERLRAGLHREVGRRLLASCVTACPSCLEHGGMPFGDRALLDRRFTYRALVELRSDATLDVEAQSDADALVLAIRGAFRSGRPRVYLAFPLAAQPRVSEAIARLLDEGVALEVGRHPVVVAASHLRDLGLPDAVPRYEIGLELGDIR